MISTQVADEDLDAACPDIDAPYEFSSTEMCAQISTDDGPGPIDDGNDGCYDPTIHECDCSIASEDDCPQGMVWTSGCASCAPTDDGPGPIDDGNPGCYDVSIHECDCSIASEEDCPAPMVWTSGCASCAGGDDGGDESDSATRAVLAAAAVVAALVF